eukprot:4874304-Amphidinium_carterae.1
MAAGMATVRVVMAASGNEVARIVCCSLRHREMWASPQLPFWKSHSQQRFEVQAAGSLKTKGKSLEVMPEATVAQLRKAIGSRTGANRAAPESRIAKKASYDAMALAVP